MNRGEGYPGRWREGDGERDRGRGRWRERESYKKVRKWISQNGT